MKKVNKILSFFLALFISLVNVSPAFAKTENPYRDDLFLEDFQKFFRENYFTSYDQEIDLKMKLEFYGISDEEFPFDKIFPDGLKLDFIYFDKYSKKEEKITQILEDGKDQIDFGKFSLEEILSGKLEFNEETDDLNMALADKKIDFSNYDPDTGFTYKIHQIPNSKVEFKTFDKDGKLTANPNFGKFTYKFENLSIENLDFEKLSTDYLVKTSDIDIKLWQEDIENLQIPSVSLENSRNGYIFDDNFAYKIIKQEQKDNDWTKPLVVSLIKKERLIKNQSQPSIKNPIDGKEYLDEDYEKLKLDKNLENIAMTENITFWTLKGLDIDKAKVEEQVNKQFSFAKIFQKAKNILTNDKNTKELSEKEISKKANEKTSEKKENTKSDLDTSNKESTATDILKNHTLRQSPSDPKDQYDLNVEINLHGLAGQEFSFDKIFSAEKKAELTFEILDSNTSLVKNTITKAFSPREKSINLGKFTKEEIENSKLRLSDDFKGKLIETTSKDFGDGNTCNYKIDLHEIQNMQVIFKTIDVNGNTIENPNATFTYNLPEENSFNIPKDSTPVDTFKDEYMDKYSWAGYFDGSIAPKVDLVNAKNGFIVDGDNLYKIQNQEQKDNDKANPLEDTLIKKEKVIMQTEHPKIKDPNTGAEIDDPDYVKVEFKSKEHSTIVGENPTYWVLKDIDLGNAIKAPELSLDEGYELYDWSDFKSENQIYHEDTTHYPRSFYQYYFTTYYGDIVNYKIPIKENSNIVWYCLVDYLFDQASDDPALDKGKDSVSGEGAGISMVSGKIHNPGTKEAETTLRITAEKETRGGESNFKKYLYVQDADGNSSWIGINVKVKEQKEKGTFIPKDFALFKDDIYRYIWALDDLDRYSTFIYNSDVPEQNRTGENAIHEIINGKQILRDGKYFYYSPDDQDINKLDRTVNEVQHLKAKIKYFDNSVSEVTINVRFISDVQTGMKDSGYKNLKTFLVIPLVGILLSIILIRKKNYKLIWIRLKTK